MHATTHTAPGAANAGLFPDLAGPPPQQADQPARFCVWGLLQEPAHVYTTPGGGTQLHVLITQHLQRHPDARHVLAVYHYPDQGCPAATAMAAQSKARRLPAGAEVLATGEALYPGHYPGPHGEPVTVLGAVCAITLIDDVIPHPVLGAQGA